MDLNSIYGIFVFLIYILLAYRVKYISGNWFFNPFTLQLLTFAISLGTVLYVFYSGFISEVELQTVLMFFLFFGISIFLIKYYVGRDKLLTKKNSKVKKIDYQVLYVLFFVSLLVSVLYSFLLWSSYSTGDERLILNRQYRTLALLQMLLVFWTVVLAAIIYAQHKRKTVLMIMVLLIMISFLSGSKGAALGFFLWATMYYVYFNKISIRKTLTLLILLCFVLFFPTWWMYGEDFVEKILFRLSMSGDVYLLSFISGDYTELTGLYDPLEYLYHPFTSLLGVRGYEYPFGAELIGTAGLAVTGTGPNPHLPMLALTFWPESFLSRVLFAIITTIVFVLTVFSAYAIYNNLRFPLFFRIGMFSMMLSAAFSLFVDVGMYEFKMILCILIISIYIVVIFLQQASQSFKQHKGLTH